VAQRKKIITEIAASVDAGTPNKWVDAEDFARVVNALKAYSWVGSLVSALEAKAATLPAAENGK